MVSFSHWVLKGLACLMALLCTSCIGMMAPKTAQIERPPASGAAETSSRGPQEGPIVDKWELMYQINEKGDQELPNENMRVLMEFTNRGQVIVNKISKDPSDPVKSTTGRYEFNDKEISATDQEGNSAKWPYKLTGDMLVTTMPVKEKNVKFYWRRYR